MNEVNFVDIQLSTGETVTFAIIHHGNEHYSSMTKAHYDEIEAQREQSGTL